MIPTSDPDILIEYQDDSGNGYVCYRRISDGRRWIVRGKCDRRGDCLIGAKIGRTVIRDHKHLEQVKKRLGKERIDSELDVPVTPEFKTCCGADIFRYEELKPRA